MGFISSVVNSTAGSAWDQVKETVRGASKGDVADVAKVAVGVAMATGAMPVSTGIATLAGTAVAGSLLDVFA